MFFELRPVLVVFLFVLVGCDAAPPASGDGGPGAIECASDEDCDDGLACNGLERCDATDHCAPAAEELCLAGQTCDEGSDDCETDCAVTVDADGDGHDAAECGGTDCDDSDARRFPGNTEICDTADHDEDCDPVTFGVRDQDSDGEADARCCNADPAGTRQCGTDCDDTSGNVHPGQAETCNERDDDCDGSIDEEALATFYPDADHDGFGDASATPTGACVAPEGFADQAGDCDDAVAAANPGAPEICDGIDNDCDGTIDEGLLEPLYPDADRDGAGDLAATATMRCPGEGWVATSTDCDDTSPAVRPGLSEICDGLDNDCDASVDESTVMVPWYVDSDGDGYGDPRQPAVLSCTPIAGRSQLTECDDHRADVHPGAAQLCDRVDNTCSTDDGSGRAVARASEDADSDGHAPTTADCMGGPLPRDDCDDTRATIYTGAPELCDRIDQNCSSMGGVATEEDADNDGHAPIGASCTGGTLPRDDCDDSRANAYPGATERCNGLDDDCSSGGGALAAEDADGDHYAPLGAMCSGGSFPRTDCDDTRAGVNPGATEICNGIDDDCSGTTDLGCPEDVLVGAPGSTILALDGFCSSPVNRTATCPAGTVATRLQVSWVRASSTTYELRSLRVSCSDLAIVAAGGAGSPITYTVSVGAPSSIGTLGRTTTSFTHDNTCPAGSVITGTLSGGLQIRCSPLTIPAATPGTYTIALGTATTVGTVGGTTPPSGTATCPAGQAMVHALAQVCGTSGNEVIGDWSLACGALSVDPL